MNAAVMVAGPAAARARAQRRVISHFLSRNAVSADTAIGYDPGRRMERRVFARLRDLGVIVAGQGGSFYIDIPAYDAYQQGRRKRIGLAIAAAVGAIAAGVGIGLIG